MLGTTGRPERWRANDQVMRDARFIKPRIDRGRVTFCNHLGSPSRSQKRKKELLLNQEKFANAIKHLAASHRSTPANLLHRLWRPVSDVLRDHLKLFNLALPAAAESVPLADWRNEMAASLPGHLSSGQVGVPNEAD